jgi:hypothetical protein
MLYNRFVFCVTARAAEDEADDYYANDDDDYNGPEEDDEEEETYTGPPPVIHSRPREISLKPGDTARLPCEVENAGEQRLLYLKLPLFQRNAYLILVHEY